MLTLRRHRSTRRRKRRTTEHDANTALADRPDLRIGNLLDDPRLRRAMAVDLPHPTGPEGTMHHRLDPGMR